MRILRPVEYELLERTISSADQTERDRLRGLLMSGLRYVEARRLQANPAWFDGRFVYLPREAILKHERKQLERWVRLNLLGRESVAALLKTKALPSSQTWGENMKRWGSKCGLDPSGLCAKTTRKTWESWLCFSFPQHSYEIFASQGHTGTTSFHHYLNMPFLEEDKEAMTKWTDGFF